MASNTYAVSESEIETVEDTSDGAAVSELAYDEMTDKQRRIVIAASHPEADSMQFVAEQAGVTRPYVRIVLAELMNNSDIPVGEAFDSRILSFRDRSFQDLTELQQQIVVAMAVEADVDQSDVAEYLGTHHTYVREVGIVYNHVVEQQRREYGDRAELVAAAIEGDVRRHKIENVREAVLSQAQENIENGVDVAYNDDVVAALQGL